MKHESRNTNHETRIKLVLGVIFLMAVTPVARAEEPPLPTAAEIKNLVDAGQYKDALKPISRALALKGPAAAPYVRPDLWILRAECLLQLKQDQQGALAALEQARKDAFGERKFEKMAEPTALTMLIQKSNAYKYTPRGAKEGISILDRTLRPAAYAALLADELPATKQKVDAL